jgi:hypothetical protein
LETWKSVRGGYHDAAHNAGAKDFCSAAISSVTWSDTAYGAIFLIGNADTLYNCLKQ